MRFDALKPAHEKDCQRCGDTAFPVFEVADARLCRDCALFLGSVGRDAALLDSRSWAVPLEALSAVDRVWGACSDLRTRHLADERRKQFEQRQRDKGERGADFKPRKR